MSTSDHTPSIAIVGSGIAGMTLASILSRQDNPPHIEVFERDARDRDQGTGFDVRGKAQEALKQAGVFSHYAEFSRQGSDIMRMYEPDRDTARFVLATPKFLQWIMPPSPESNRQLMREALIESFGHPDQVHFQCKVTGIRAKGKQAELLGVDGQVLGCYDLVVDGSGFSSVLRSYRIDEPSGSARFERSYTGLSMVHGLIPDPEASCDPRVVKKMGQGTMMTFDSGRAYCLQRYGAAEEDHRASLYYIVPFERISGLADEFDLPHSTRFITEKDTLDRIKAWVYEDMKKVNYPPDYLSAVEASESIALRPLLQHPHEVAFREDDLPLILVGDSLHAMPPYSGSGGNFALEDAVDLAQYLKDHQNRASVKELRDLEKKFLKRTVGTLKSANQMRDDFIQADAKRRRGETTSRLPGNSYIFYFAALLFTWIYRMEIVFGLRKDNGRN